MTSLTSQSWRGWMPGEACFRVTHTPILLFTSHSQERFQQGPLKRSERPFNLEYPASRSSPLLDLKSHTDISGLFLRLWAIVVGSWQSTLRTMTWSSIWKRNLLERDGIRDTICIWHITISRRIYRSGKSSVSLSTLRRASTSYIRRLRREHMPSPMPAINNCLSTERRSTIICISPMITIESLRELLYTLIPQ